MKKYFVIGNPIEHSLSPTLHNFWIKKNRINAVYEKKKLEDDEINDFILGIRTKEISGANVTVPFKRSIIPFLDQLSQEAKNTQSVNTVFLDKDKLIGHNTDIFGFEASIKNIKIDLNNKDILILGAGGVVPSIIFALKKMNVLKITVSNRTRARAENLKDLFKELSIVDWGDIPDSDVIINATSIGLKKNDKMKLNFSKLNNCKLFYDVIYNPSETDFLRTGREAGYKTENGKMMFIYQAHASFKAWHGIEPEINNEAINLLGQ